MKYTVLNISNNLKAYPECKEDTEANSQLVPHVDDEMDLFIVDSNGQWWKADEFFNIVNIREFVSPETCASIIFKTPALGPTIAMNDHSMHSILDKIDAEINFLGSTGVLAGALYLYIDGVLVNVPIFEAMTADEIATATAEAINADTEMHVTATALTTVVSIYANADSPYEKTTIYFNIGQPGIQKLPIGVIASIIDSET